jgi:two-component system, NtrC family, response regulator AtoC
MAARLLVVEDDPSVRRSLAETLAEDGFEVDTADSAEQALGRLGEPPPDIILSDVRMPGMSGLELLELLRERLPSVDVILMTAYEDMPTVARAMREGAFDFLVKPLRRADLRAVLARVVEDRRTRERAQRRVEAEGEEYALETLVGRHPGMIDIYKRVGQVAAGRVNVLILGETGTGKERVARAIHHHSAVAAEPFIAVNCTALPEPLLESELFGHLKGAFTGAVADRRGRFELAGRGTIFLDEIGDTSPAFQAKLLRVLENREFYPVGAERPERTEARVLAATHHDLEALVAAGDFREDLYYRLRVVEIRIPPLRERLSDLPLLARHFVQKAARELHRAPAALPDETLSVLLRYHWPGNVRELENCLARAVVLASGNVVRPGHLGLATERDEPREDGDMPALEAMERVHLERALATAGGNRTRAAELLRVSRPRLYRMLQKHGLD